MIAVEIHQISSTSSDISFDLKLIGEDNTMDVIRGPYLQNSTENSIVVRWRTDSLTKSIIHYGNNLQILIILFRISFMFSVLKCSFFPKGIAK